MKLSVFKDTLKAQTSLQFNLPNGQAVPAHFHVTEVGQINKHFIDCGGTERKDSVINFQLWEATDYDHRLAPEKLMNIINLAENKLGLGDFEIEVEYQGDTIQKFGLEAAGNSFQLVSKTTDCLAMDKCGVTAPKVKLSMVDLGQATGETCEPGGNCC